MNAPAPTKTLRPAAPTDFTVSVPGVGDFIFARRTIGDGIRIRREFARLVGDVLLAEADVELSAWANIVATITILRVVTPPAFAGDIEAIPVTDEAGTMDQLVLVFDALRAKEGTFRSRPASPSTPSGEGASGNDPVVVPPALQPTAQ